MYEKTFITNFDKKLNDFVQESPEQKPADSTTIDALRDLCMESIFLTVKGDDCMSAEGRQAIHLHFNEKLRKILEGKNLSHADMQEQMEKIGGMFQMNFGESDAIEQQQKTKTVAYTHQS